MKLFCCVVALGSPDRTCSMDCTFAALVGAYLDLGGLG